MREPPQSRRTPKPAARLVAQPETRPASRPFAISSPIQATALFSFGELEPPPVVSVPGEGPVQRTAAMLGFRFMFKDIKDALHVMALGIDDRRRNLNKETLPDELEKADRTRAVQEGEDVRDRVQVWNVRFAKRLGEFIKKKYDFDGWEQCKVSIDEVEKGAADLFPGLDKFNVIVADFNNLPGSLADYAAGGGEKFATVLIHNTFTASAAGYCGAIKQIVHGGSQGRGGPNTTTRHLHVDGDATDNLIFLLGSPVRILGKVAFHMESGINNQQRGQVATVQNRYNVATSNFTEYEIGHKGTIRVVEQNEEH